MHRSTRYIDRKRLRRAKAAFSYKQLTLQFTDFSECWSYSVSLDTTPVVA
jgi:hypothetical protein